jgi:hypothetical protein
MIGRAKVVRASGPEASNKPSNPVYCFARKSIRHDVSM